MAVPETIVRRTQHLPSLTGLRGIAAGAVFVDHLGWMLGATPLGAGWTALRGIGINAVLLFFVLSGFLLARPAALRDGATAFLTRRAARIYPVYALALVLAIGALVLADPDSPLLAPGSLLSNGLLLQSWDVGASGASISMPAWSLSVEVLFYATLPFTLRPVARLFRGTPRWSLAGLTALALLGGEALRHDWVWATCPPAYLPVFYLGVHAAVTSSPGVRSVPVGVLVAVASVAGYSAVPNLALPALGFMVLVSTLAARDRRGAPVLAGPAWQRVGVWSFAFFLIHMPVLQAVGALLPERPTTGVAGLAASTLAFLVSWALAAAVYRLLEEPGRRAVLRWTARRGGSRERMPVARRPASAAAARRGLPGLVGDHPADGDPGLRRRVVTVLVGSGGPVPVHAERAPRVDEAPPLLAGQRGEPGVEGRAGRRRATHRRDGDQQRVPGADPRRDPPQVRRRHLPGQQVDVVRPAEQDEHVRGRRDDVGQHVARGGLGDRPASRQHQPLRGLAVQP
ncbi:acyltransferase [Geodermatophilus sabuli]|uniref:Acyltransferase n=1 Tax=Geodermatophilus sabuli TaxID=1564158 RepID=A0A7K3VZZ9_9ACTN|nr:acyltransferase [Geodermatophilus sabuli]